MNQVRLPTVGILIFDDAEVLDFCGPFEVFTIARQVGERSDESKLFTVITIAEEDRLVTCRGGLLVKPHFTIENHPPLDILVVPGGQGTRRELSQRVEKCTHLLSFIRKATFLTQRSTHS